ncbi:nicotinate phosphoribosyltransferase-like [Ylistrum balloti]|uniref:nicotinate phosphoribosyltransferase-like n=1 Tax=Ylistrum balloti TaxID=509963 RepID=UPI002905929A|nr:nicotinate phosphoribosyltransferase-like [Ylistrum balloti]
MVSTKAARVCYAAKNTPVAELGLRRAPGHSSALIASRAAYIGGIGYSSNVEASKLYNIPYIGTMSHSWVMNFDTERDAFHTYSRLYPKNAVFLLDTYDTLKSGIVHAIEAGKTLVQQGNNFGVRLDSGDIDYLSRTVRAKLNSSGLEKAFIVATNNLDEEIISDLTAAHCPIDMWGLGTKLVSNEISNSIEGVYKLCAKQDENKHTFTGLLKVSNNIKKTTLPGIKQVFRYYSHKADLSNTAYIADVIASDSVEGKENPQMFSGAEVHHPLLDHRKFTLSKHALSFPLLQKVFEKGEIIYNEDVQTMRSNVEKQLGCIDSSFKRLLNPHVYKVSISTELKSLRDSTLEKVEETYRKEEL